MYTLGFLFALCFCNVISYKVNLDSEEYKEWRRGVPAPASSKETSTGKCIKDLVILVDASRSITGRIFNSKVKAFLRNLISNPQLNVGPDGTQIAFVIFRDKDDTKYLLNFDARTQEEYKTFINNTLTYSDRLGGQTYTGKALGIVDKEIFKTSSPENIRPKIDDVVLLLTDGKPNGGHAVTSDKEKNLNSEMVDARNHSNSLKEKNVLIVGVAFGQKGIVRNFLPEIERLSTSNKTTFDSDIDSLDKILDQIVSASCIKPAQCSCSSIQSQTKYIVPPATTVDVSWPTPTFQCGNNQIPEHTRTINPNIVAPHSFSVGHHPIEYTYTFSGESLKCYVNITVESCKCPNTAPIIKDLAPGKTTVTVEWRKPEPKCPHTLSSVSPSEAKSGKMNFGFGEHVITYSCNIKNAPKSPPLKCKLRINVGGKVCGGVGMYSAQVCCCGKAYDSKPNHECCGYQYYDKSNKKCFHDSNTLVDLSP
ncbi:uncharacterized protein LOC124448899 [Xenia sp. Carnegie-2017]|uniref:uncharacterized protein LOC124448899 n=1 Tax=Xenia sp. Carnegie-2017 TaxID=2897299 RepID=UPI001F049DA3|nr:uncharacterized protein LOC124448899 [Xenia sp. Carnegie-2017]